MSDASWSGNVRDLLPLHTMFIPCGTHKDDPFNYDYMRETAEAFIKMGAHFLRDGRCGCLVVFGATKEQEVVMFLHELAMGNISIADFFRVVANLVRERVMRAMPNHPPGTTFVPDPDRPGWMRAVAPKDPPPAPGKQWILDLDYPGLEKEMETLYHTDFIHDPDPARHGMLKMTGIEPILVATGRRRFMRASREEP